MVLRWLSKPRLSYLDCAVTGVSAGLVPHMGWWAVIPFVLGMFLSVAVEMAFRQRAA